MNERDLGNENTKNIYKLATEPMFSIDHNIDRNNISWEISDGNLPESPPEKEIISSDTSHDFIQKDHINEGEWNGEEPKESIDFPEESTEEKEEESSEEEESEEKEKIKKKNRTSERKRIADLNRQLKQSQSVTRDVLIRNQQLETKLAEKQKEALDTEENFLKSQKERVKQYLTNAIEEGDPAKIAEAHDILSQYNAEIQLKKSQKITIPSISQDNYQRLISDIENSSYPVNEEEGLEWIQKNNWANPNSEDFDEELYKFADTYSVKLSKKYALQGKKSEIGSSQFWGEITDYMNKSFEIDNKKVSPSPHSFSQSQTLQRSRTPMKNNPSNVVAPTRESFSPHNSPKQNHITLTPEQRQAAHSMSGYVRDPKTGQKITDFKMLEEIYKRNMG